MKMVLRSSYQTMGGEWSLAVLWRNLKRFTGDLNVFDGWFFTWAVLILAVIGAFKLYRRDKASFGFILVLAVGMPSPWY